MHEQLLTYQESAERLNISVRTLRRMTEAGKIKPISFGTKTVRFRLSDLERLIATFDTEQN